MKLFRWHRGGLEESLATMVEVVTRAELFEHLQNTGGRLSPNTPEDIRIEPYDMSPDARIGWPQTWAVSVRVDQRPFEMWTLIGFSDGPLEGT